MAIEKDSKTIKNINNKSKKSTGIKGGARAGAGRKKGEPNKKTAALQKQVEESGITPLDFMLKIMRQPDLDDDAEVALKISHNSVRFEAAKAAAPYVHSKLASVEVSGKGGEPLVVQVVDFATLHKNKS